LANQHTESTDDEERSTTELLDRVEGDWGGADIDEGEDEGDDEWVGDGAGRLEEGSGVVEDEVHTRPDDQLVAGMFKYGRLGAYHCCIICSDVPKIVRRMFDFCSQRDPEKQFIQLETNPEDGMMERSYSSLATISANST
jgi:hypothetical protein